MIHGFNYSYGRLGLGEKADDWFTYSIEVPVRVCDKVLLQEVMEQAVNVVDELYPELSKSIKK